MASVVPSDTAERSLLALARSVEHAAPNRFYRAAGDMAASLAEDVRRSGRLNEADLPPGLDPLDALTHDLVITGGSVLAATTLLHQADVEDVRKLVAPAFSPAFWQAEAIVAGEGAAVRLESPQAARAPSMWRERAFEARKAFSLVADRPLRARTPAVLVVVQQPGHLADALPLLDALSEIEVSASLLVADKRTQAAAEEAGRSFIVGWPSGRGERMRVLAASRRVRSAVLAVAREGPPSLDRVAFVDTLERVLRRQLPSVLALGSVVRSRMLSGASVVVAVNPYDYAGRTAASIARGVGFSAGLEHGSILPIQSVWERCPVEAMCVHGEPSRRALQQAGYPGTIEVTGSTRSAPDEVDAPDAPAAGAADDHLLVATSGPGGTVALEQHLGFIETLYRAAAATPELRWVVRLHPKDRKAFYRDARRAFPQADVELQAPGHDVTRTGIYDDLSGAAALVTVGSTAAVDAARVGVPVIAVAAERTELTDLEYLERTATWKVDTVDGLVAAARAAWTARPAAEAEEYVREHFGREDGAATTARYLRSHLR